MGGLGSGEEVFPPQKATERPFLFPNKTVLSELKKNIKYDFYASEQLLCDQNRKLGLVWLCWGGMRSLKKLLLKRLGVVNAGGYPRTVGRRLSGQGYS